MMLPRLIVIDDLFGRDLAEGPNADRENLCAHFLWRDVTSDASARASHQKVVNPRAEVVFCRGQKPVRATVGDRVENDLEYCLAEIRAGWTESIARGNPPLTLALLDLCFYTGEVTMESHAQTPGMPDGCARDADPRSYFGLVLLDAIHRELPDLPVFILSSKPRDEVSLEFSRRGALGFIARDDLRGPELLEEALWLHGLLPDPVQETIGSSPELLLALREARRASRHRENLLIRGERGTGKELLARYVHRMSSLSDKSGKRPFVVVNSALFTASLFASELFGIQPRTATGVNGKTGLIESANCGDLFLDEIADMPAEVQGAMLRVLQDRHIIPVGGRVPREVDVRFLSATNADLEGEVFGFRPDLLDRLRIGGTLWLPPLRERIADIPLLTESFVREAESRQQGALRHRITPDALELLSSCEWPGNIRELRSVVFDAVNRHPDVEFIVPGHLRLGSKGGRSSKSRTPRTGKASTSRDNSGPVDAEQGIEDESFTQLLDRMARFEFSFEDRGAWAGEFGRFQSVIAQLVARYIRVALLANRRPTPENPAGDILIHPAMKLLTGDRNLTASRAADFIKRHLKFSPKDHDQILTDEVLREAYQIAKRLRPTRSQRKPSDGGSNQADTGAVT